MQPPDDISERLRASFDDLCFACGRENHLGLGLDNFAYGEGEATATFTPRPFHRGLQSQLHGGLSATALDEILVWAGILGEGVMSVTGTLDLRYRRPVPVDGVLTVRGRVDERRGRRLKVSGSLDDAEGPCVTGSGLYLVTGLVADLIDR